MRQERLIRVATLIVLCAMSVILLAAAVWTGKYWASDSMTADAVRAKSGYFGGIFELVSAGEIPFGARLKLLLFVTSPISCSILSTIAAGLILLQLRGRAMWRPTCALAALILLGTWFGLQSLRLIEDRIFYDDSPWVSTFQTLAFPLAALALTYLLFIAAIFLRTTLRPEAADSKEAVSRPTAT